MAGRDPQPTRGDISPSTLNASKLTSANLPWRQRSLAYQQAFPEYEELILAIVRAPTAELVSGARNTTRWQCIRIQEHARVRARESRASREMFSVSQLRRATHSHDMSR